MQSETQTGKNERTIALITAMVAAYLITFMASSLNIALPVIGKEFKIDAILLSWILTSYVLTTAIFSLPFGRIADLIGIKKIFVYGILLFTVGTVLAPFSSSFTMLILARLIQGVGASMFMGNSLAMLTAVFPPKERGSAIGVNVAAVYLGSSTGPILGGTLTEHFGWRSIFWFSIVLGIVVILLLTWKVKGEWCNSRGEKFDYTGLVIYGLALVIFMYGFVILPKLLAIPLIVVGITGFVLFYFWESRVEKPLLDIKVFKNNRTFLFSNLASLINICGLFSVSFLLSLYLQYIKGFSPEQAGLVMIMQPLIQVVISPLAGRMSDKVEPRIVASIGMSLTCAGLLSFVILSNNTSIAQIIISLMILGMGFALFSSPNTNAVMSSVEPRYYAVAAATTSTVRCLGQTFSMGIAALVIAVVVGRVVITAEYYPLFLTAVRISFAISGILCFGGIFASLSRGKLR